LSCANATLPLALCVWSQSFYPQHYPTAWEGRMPHFQDSLVVDKGNPFTLLTDCNLVAFLCVLFKEWTRPSKLKGKAKVRGARARSPRATPHPCLVLSPSHPPSGASL
jgi:hypothetical protein